MLIGKTLTDVVVDQNGAYGDSITFITNKGTRYIMNHEQDCCEYVRIEDIVGDTNDLIGSPIIKASEVTSNEYPKQESEDSFTWTFYNIATIKGHVTIRWYGSSNGYYSERVDIRKEGS